VSLRKLDVRHIECITFRNGIFGYNTLKPFSDLPEGPSCHGCPFPFKLMVQSSGPPCRKSKACASWQLIRRIVIPGAMPSILIGIRYGAGLAWAMVVIAEGLSGMQGLGYLIFRAQALLLTDLATDRPIARVHGRYRPGRLHHRSRCPDAGATPVTLEAGLRRTLT
jgi:Binding-protein-dependent transport system inner membrane component